MIPGIYHFFACVAFRRWYFFEPCTFWFVIPFADLELRSYFSDCLFGTAGKYLTEIINVLSPREPDLKAKKENQGCAEKKRRMTFENRNFWNWRAQSRRLVVPHTSTKWRELRAPRFASQRTFALAPPQWLWALQAIKMRFSVSLFFSYPLFGAFSPLLTRRDFWL